MPLDGQLYLLNQGWRGKGTGLRDGAITRPLAIPQKKNLAGLGKDRDEAFPFWDHLFTAAAKSIQLKCLSDSDGEANFENSACSQDVTRRTTTGILSNRRPEEGTPAVSNPSTPNADSDSGKPSISLIVTAKRNAAKQRLYSRFFRGPVLGPDDGKYGSISYDTTQSEEASRSLVSANDADVVKKGRALKRKTDLKGRSGEGSRHAKKKRTTREEKEKEKRFGF